jgi:hypothetical protein
VLPNRAQMASTDPPFTFDIAEAQLIGIAIAAGGAVAALLRPGTRRPQKASQRPEHLTSSPYADTHWPRSRFRPLGWLRARKQ